MTNGPRTSTDAIARAILLRMGVRKWYAIRVAESLCRVLRISGRTSEPVAIDLHGRLRLLVIEYWQLGDLAIAVPFLRQLRHTFPNAHISLLVNEPLQAFLQGQQLVDEFIPVRVPWAQHFSRWKKYSPFSSLWIPFVRVILNLRERKFDVGFSGRMDFRDNFLLWLSGTSHRVGYGFAGGGSFLTEIVAPDVSRPHRTYRWLQLLEPFGSSRDNVEEEFKFEDGMRQRAADLLCSWNIDEHTLIVGIHPGARSRVRRWGDDNFKEVASRLLQNSDVTILWFCEPGKESVPLTHPRCHIVAGEFHEFLSILARCQLLICNDSGPMHMANLLRVPVVAVFGPQNPSWFGPTGSDDRVVIHPEMPCRPCFDYCIFDQPYCLRAISPEKTMISVNQALQAIRNESSAADVDKGRVAIASGERSNHD
jgi:ADP-heptose:LPS heptosyltransferase